MERKQPFSRGQDRFFVRAITPNNLPYVPSSGSVIDQQVCSQSSFVTVEQLPLAKLLSSMRPTRICSLHGTSDRHKRTAKALTRSVRRLLGMRSCRARVKPDRFLRSRSPYRATGRDRLWRKHTRRRRPNSASRRGPCPCHTAHTRGQPCCRCPP